MSLKYEKIIKQMTLEEKARMMSGKNTWETVDFPGYGIPSMCLSDGPHGLPKIDFGFPGIDITLFGETFKWNIIGYDAQHGGLPYFCAYMVAMVLGECINFPIQRNFVFRSKGKVGYQAFWYLIAFCIVTCIVNSINCIWVAVAGMFVPDWLYNIGTTVLNGGVSMLVFFFVNKIIFPEGAVKA